MYVAVVLPHAPILLEPHRMPSHSRVRLLAALLYYYTQYPIDHVFYQAITQPLLGYPPKPRKYKTGSDSNLPTHHKM